MFSRQILSRSQQLITSLSALLMLCAMTAHAQSAAFTYQGRLTEGTVPAGGLYDLKFRLYDSAGAQVGMALTREDVQVVNGVFTVTLDFGADAFDGAARLLEIGVRPGGSADGFTTLTPRQPVTSTPYALRSLNAGTAATATTAETATAATNAAQLGGVEAAQYVRTDDPRLVDGGGPPAPGSPNYIQNGTTQQADAGFNISGSGYAGGLLSADSVYATNHYYINGRRVLSIPGTSNTFVGENSGQANSGSGNSFFGRSAGLVNSTGGNNAFFGSRAGLNNSTGGGNAFFGADAGLAPSGSNNTLLGSSTRTGVFGLNFASAIGSGATVSTSNTVVLGRPFDTVSVPGGLDVIGALNANGSSLTTLNASNITTGTLDNARLGTVPATKGGTGLIAAGANGNLLRSNGTAWTSAPLAGVDLPAGSVNYIQNTTTAQPGNFNIAGNGTAAGTLSGNVVSAATQFNIGSNRVFSTLGTDFEGTLNTNVFAGVGTGSSNTTGVYNSVFGYEAGNKNTTGFVNSFFGNSAGFNNVSGFGNSFFGHEAGFTFTSGLGNNFFGSRAGYFLTTGSNNTFIGNGANPLGTNSLSNATAIGSGALVSRSNSLVLGDADVNVGIGTSAPSEKLTVETPTNSYGIIHTDKAITVGTFVGGAGNGGYLGTKSNHPFHLFANDGSASLTIDTSGFVRVSNLGSAGSTQLCRNGSNQIATCSSSLRYKTNIAPFSFGLELVKRLQPITFDWKSNGEHDMGFGAEDVAAIEPLLVTRNPSGAVEGVKYDRVAVILVNAVLEQQTQMDRQQDEIKRLANQIQNLKQLVCLSNPTADACK